MVFTYCCDSHHTAGLKGDVAHMPLEAQRYIPQPITINLRNFLYDCRLDYK
jgi:hypothetical protein